MPKDAKPKKNKASENKAKKSQGKRKRKSLLEQIREGISKSSPGGFLISKSRERVDKVLENLKK
jgi:hypothetical protein